MPELTNYHGLGTSQRNHTLEGSQAVLNRAYVYANGKLLAEQTPDGQFYWTHNDHLGSTRKLTNTSGVVVYRAEYDPFGQLLMETGSVSLNSHKFTGYERDWATGLDNANARMFASLRGRFMQSDPVTQGCGGNAPDILAGADKRLPESLNRYNYVVNDPVNRTDPGGYSAFLEMVFRILRLMRFCVSWGCWNIAGHQGVPATTPVPAVWAVAVDSRAGLPVSTPVVSAALRRRWLVSVLRAPVRL